MPAPSKQQQQAPTNQQQAPTNQQQAPTNQQQQVPVITVPIRDLAHPTDEQHPAYQYAKTYQQLKNSFDRVFRSLVPDAQTSIFELTADAVIRNHRQGEPVSCWLHDCIPSS